eukprot:14263269-Ditylum_brightwellii.AAC.1
MTRYLQSQPKEAPATFQFSTMKSCKAHEQTLLLLFHFHKVPQYRPPVTSNMVIVSNLTISHYSSSSKGEKEEEINEDRQKKSIERNE